MNSGLYLGFQNSKWALEMDDRNGGESTLVLVYFFRSSYVVVYLPGDICAVVSFIEVLRCSPARASLGTVVERPQGSCMTCVKQNVCCISIFLLLKHHMHLLLPGSSTVHCKWESSSPALGIIMVNSLMPTRLNGSSPLCCNEDSSPLNYMHIVPA